MSVDRIPELVGQLYAVVAELESSFPGRRFTPDGHLVGSLGEVLAAHYYSLKLLPNSTADHDATTEDGLLVQIKATQRDSFALRADCDHLLALKIDRTGGFEEIYNGPGTPVWNAAGKRQNNGQRPISIFRLRKLNAQVPEGTRLRRTR